MPPWKIWHPNQEPTPFQVYQWIRRRSLYMELLRDKQQEDMDNINGSNG
jgi:hypothetical protein